MTGRPLTYLDAKNRVPVVAHRPGQAPVTGRLVSLPNTNRRRRRHGTRARIQLPTGAYLSIPPHQLTRATDEEVTA